MSAYASAPRAVITGVGLISALGDRLDTLHQGLTDGATGLGALDLFEPGPLADHPLRLAVGQIRGFDASEYLPEGNLRPLDRTGRLVASAAQLALDDGGWPPEARQETEVGLLLGTMYCSVRTIAEFDRRAQSAGPIYAKPMDFANSVLNSAAGQCAIWHDLRGVNSTFGGGPTAGLQALGAAVDLIRGGRAEAILAGGAEELSFESLFALARAGELASGDGNGTPPRPVPFDHRRDGLTAGEGACLLVVEDGLAARRRGATTLGAILGHGSAFATTPGEAAEAMARAVEAALAESGLAPGDLVAWSSGASGLPDLDRAELAGVAAALGDRLETLPTTATKGALGETLGAAGAFQTAVALRALAVGRLPGISGLERRDASLPAVPVSADAAAVSDGPALVTALGREGTAVALLIAGPSWATPAA